MNYRHIFHAGNFADVLKHVVLARILLHLKQKEAPFRVIDTHAGAGWYDLSGAEAEKTGEWRSGVARLDEAPLAAEAEALIAPYRSVLAAIRGEYCPAAYPGSPEIARRMTRPSDRIVAIESEERAFASLRAAFGRDRRAKAVRLDGWTGLLAYVPPRERRGLVLIDPPYEDSAEFQTVADKLAAAWRKWPSGVYCIWYPVVDAELVERFVGRVQHLGVSRVLRAELRVHRSRSPLGLRSHDGARSPFSSPAESSLPGGKRASGSRIQCDSARPTEAPAQGRAAAQGRGLGACGLLIVNPPWKLPAELRVLLPALADRMGSGNDAGWRLDQIAPEAAVARAREPAE